MKTLTSVSVNDINKKSFFRALSILIRKPQVINRKLSCSVNKLFLKINIEKQDFLQKFKNIDENLKDVLKAENICYQELTLDDDLEHVGEGSIYVSLDKHLPRFPNKYHAAYVLTIIGSWTASIYSLNTSNKLILSAPYQLSLKENELAIESASEDSEVVRVLIYVIFRKFKKWINDCKEDDKKIQLKLNTHSSINGEDYNNLYTFLKEKYGKKMEEIWNEESTNPKKYIYEDVAIATYLLLLWKREKQKFVDLGCGNGLLVYILTVEGNDGYGIDIRSRKIWKKFQPQVDLRETTWHPTHVFNDIDWIIGNHSDELSPWISIVAAKNSFNCNYFLLPCCAFELSGAKFSTREKDKSLYMSYINYLIKISKDICGFETTVDRMKIPSTKRICLIGSSRSYHVEDFSNKCKVIDEYIKTESDNNFAPRDRNEVVRNCTKVDKNVIDRIVDIIFYYLLDKEEKIIEGWWNIGGEMELSDAAKLISSSDLNALKYQCGGLQTLFKIKHNVFEVKFGKVKLRKPRTITEAKNKKIKIYACYHHNNHPQKCLHNDENCLYIHEK